MVQHALAREMQKQFRECPLGRFDLIEPGTTGVGLFEQLDNLARELPYGLRHSEKAFSRRQSAQSVGCLGKIVAHGTSGHFRIRFDRGGGQPPRRRSSAGVIWAAPNPRSTVRRSGKQNVKRQPEPNVLSNEGPSRQDG
jgi:hypothetical protein